MEKPSKGIDSVQRTVVPKDEFRTGYLNKAKKNSDEWNRAMVQWAQGRQRSKTALTTGAVITFGEAGMSYWKIKGDLRLTWEKFVSIKNKLTGIRNGEGSA